MMMNPFGMSGHPSNDRPRPFRKWIECLQTSPQKPRGFTLKPRGIRMFTHPINIPAYETEGPGTPRNPPPPHVLPTHHT